MEETAGSGLPRLVRSVCRSAEDWRCRCLRQVRAEPPYRGFVLAEESCSGCAGGQMTHSPGLFSDICCFYNLQV